jgi:hypothetical protein
VDVKTAKHMLATFSMWLLPNHTRTKTWSNVCVVGLALYMTWAGIRLKKGCFIDTISNEDIRMIDPNQWAAGAEHFERKGPSWQDVIDALPIEVRRDLLARALKTRRRFLDVHLNGTQYLVRRATMRDYLRKTLA